KLRSPHTPSSASSPSRDRFPGQSGAPECPGVCPSQARFGHNRDQKRRRLSANSRKSWWAETGLNRRHQDFQSWNTRRGRAQKSLPCNQEVIRSSCAGVVRSDQECAPDGHILGTLHLHFGHTSPSLSRCLWRDLYDRRVAPVLGWPRTVLPPERVHDGPVHDPRREARRRRLVLVM